MMESETRMELARARAGVDGRARSRWPKHTKFQLGGRISTKGLLCHVVIIVNRKVYTLENNSVPTSKKGLRRLT